MRFRDFHKNIKIRIIETFTSRFVGGMIFPFMTIYLASHFGAKTTGLLLLINIFIGIANSFLGGYLSDQFGRKKVMFWAECARFAAFFMMMVSNSPFFESPSITFMMMIINSICWGMAGPANDAMMIDVSTPEQRKLMYSITYWANNLSIAIGGILGALLFQHYLFELFVALCVVELGVVILVAFFIEESHAKQQSNGMALHQHFYQIFKSYQKVFRDKLFIVFVIAGVLVFSMELQLTNYIGIRLSEHMPTQYLLFWPVNGLTMMGILRSENTLLVALLVLFVSKVSHLLKDKTTLVISCMLFSVGYGVLSYSNNVWLLVSFMIVLTIGEVFRVPVEQSYAAAIPPENARSIYMAINGLKYNLAMLIASLTITIGTYLTPLATSLIITAIGLGGTGLYFVIIPYVERRIHLRNQPDYSEQGMEI
ncbi:MDR family MFS transporter [Sporolactobacillus laevolacticus]|uniref:MDR family MFS transporter n=1 Tax=Sporolactobacillus laevolacticus TaxID=33018 RepID=UPI0025B542C9|nr:MFS transporter [Sporolactobacillus laevolacticus]MDN3956386.1 MFS transporter [Sporolactobacillus laevolacticus]